MQKIFRRAMPEPDMNGAVNRERSGRTEISPKTAQAPEIQLLDACCYGFSVRRKMLKIRETLIYSE
jgi:hypothetical protein